MNTPAAEAYAQAQQTPPPPTTTGQTLTHADRCDSCGAQAWVKTEAYDTLLPLYWCAHHFTAIEQHFTEMYYAVTDERSFLRAAVKAQHTRQEIH